MNITLTHARLAPAFSKTRGEIDLIKTTPPDMAKSKTVRKRALMAMSFVLVVGVVCVALIIGTGTSTAQAGSLPAFSAASALAAKQNAGVGGIAVASIALVAIGMLALFYRKNP